MATHPHERFAYPPEHIVATGVSYEDYLEFYAAEHCEWDDGVVVKMSPASLRHTVLISYLLKLLEAYFELRPIGNVYFAPFTMKLLTEAYTPEPNLQVIRKTNPNTLTATGMIGAADICIEVVSPESVDRDRGRKFSAYEKGGVREYWLVDPLRSEALFYRLNDDGLYIAQVVDIDGKYQTPLLPGLALHVPTLWQYELPGPVAVVAAVQAMLNQA